MPDEDEREKDRVLRMRGLSELVRPRAGKAERAEAKSKAKGMRADAPEFVPVPRQHFLFGSRGIGPGARVV